MKITEHHGLPENESPAAQVYGEIVWAEGPVGKLETQGWVEPGNASRLNK